MCGVNWVLKKWENAFQAVRTLRSVLCSFLPLLWCWLHHFSHGHYCCFLTCLPACILFLSSPSSSQPWELFIKNPAVVSTIYQDKVNFLNKSPDDRISMCLTSFSDSLCFKLLSCSFQPHLWIFLYCSLCLEHPPNLLLSDYPDLSYHLNWAQWPSSVLRQCPVHIKIVHWHLSPQFKLRVSSAGTMSHLSLQPLKLSTDWHTVCPQEPFTKLHFSTYCLTT